MDVAELTRTLVDIESVTGNERAVGQRLFELLGEMAASHGGRIERMEVEADRFNVFVSFGDPAVTLSTHMDTVPPYFAAREDDEHIWGRGSCDAKGIIASMMCAATELLQGGERGFGLLFLVGEERNSAGAFQAAKNPRGSRFVINGEPTGNKLAVASKGALRCEIVAHGRMAHSAYPELGESAIEKLLDALEAVRRIDFGSDTLLGAGTLNIGVISGGRAPNVIPDEARAELLIRLVDQGDAARAAIQAAVGGKAEVREVLCIPALRLGTLQGFETTVVSFTTDIPALGTSWGTPFLIGPGTIHVAHTAGECVLKRDLHEAVRIYKQMVEQLSRQ